ncbi:MAG: MerR family transcriptional regulator [Bacteroidetes bacterium GWF2_49_14]|nr:MAG: MerR family transcriptional regulator [Bacteroidetes bacterium GWF2_49_14]HBB93650.1 MerR family transcriptional regulator [Bacteroidales bacterium]
MEKESLIALDEFCALHNIEVSFVSSLSQNGLISITTIQESGFIDNGQLQQLEKFIRLYYELDINLEGIETITYLLQRITTQQNEITALRNRLRLYEKK